MANHGPQRSWYSNLFGWGPLGPEPARAPSPVSHPVPTSFIDDHGRGPSPVGLKDKTSLNKGIIEDGSSKREPVPSINTELKNLSFGDDDESPSPISYTDIPTEDEIASLGIPISSTADATRFPEPPDTKIATDVFSTPIVPLEFYPVLRWGDYTYWPLSYIDNRFSFAIVITNQSKRALKVLELHGARYIKEIQVYPDTREVSFIGQSNKAATTAWKYLALPGMAASRVLPAPRYQRNAPRLTANPPPPRYTTNPPPIIQHTPQRLPTPVMTADQQLSFYFSPPRTEYTDSDFDDISELLRTTEEARFEATPRLYTLLRHLQLLDNLDRLISKGISDSSLPLLLTQLPSDFSETWKSRFIATQHIVCHTSDVLQLILNRKHINFNDPPDFFLRNRFIGRGGRGEVDEVQCTLTGAFKVYARKRIFRQKMSSGDAETVRAFTKEVETMKKFNYHHCVQLVTSYTDRTCFGLLMLPVADFNLAEYLETAVSSPSKRSFLPGFFACLARGLWYIHRQKLHHLDIKPENILVHGDKVLFTDFDCSYDWSHTMHSTVKGIPARTREYASPEVAKSGVQHAKINHASDIWSLGCVYLEMITVLKGRSPSELDNLRRSCYWTNLQGICGWIEELRKIEQRQPFNEALDWVLEMLQEDPEKRPTAHALAEMTEDHMCMECRQEE